MHKHQTHRAFGSLYNSLCGCQLNLSALSTANTHMHTHTLVLLQQLVRRQHRLAWHAKETEKEREGNYWYDSMKALQVGKCCVCLSLFCTHIENVTSPVSKGCYPPWLVKTNRGHEQSCQCQVEQVPLHKVAPCKTHLVTDKAHSVLSLHPDHHKYTENIINLPGSIPHLVQI